MNKRIQKIHFPVSTLPPERREGLDPSAFATVTIVEEAEPGLSALLEAMDAPGRPRRSKAEIDATARSIRND